jgi:hypothetical protein
MCTRWLIVDEVDLLRSLFPKTCVYVYKGLSHVLHLVHKLQMKIKGIKNKMKAFFPKEYPYPATWP